MYETFYKKAESMWSVLWVSCPTLTLVCPAFTTHLSWNSWSQLKKMSKYPLGRCYVQENCWIQRWTPHLGNTLFNDTVVFEYFNWLEVMDLICHLCKKSFQSKFCMLNIVQYFYKKKFIVMELNNLCLLYTSPSPRD